MTSRLAVSDSSFHQGLENIGSIIQSDHGREITSFQTKVFKNDISKAVSLLGDAFTKTSVDAQALEVEREAIRAIHDNNITEYHRTLLENVHYNAFREHVMGLPSRGDCDNLANLTADDVQNFRD